MDPDITSSPKRRKQLRPHQRVCPHCDQVVSDKSFRKHKQLYFSVEKGRWLCGDARSSSESDVDEEAIYPEEEMFESDRVESSSPPLSVFLHVTSHSFLKIGKVLL